jgi:hypothetical protein
VHGTGAQLALHPPAGGQLDAGFDGRREPRLVDEHAVEAQHVRDQVVGEHRELVESRRSSRFAGPQTRTRRFGGVPQ